MLDESSKSVSEHKGLPVLAFASVQMRGTWLTQHGGGSRGVWLKFAKKRSDITSVGKSAAIEVALTFGWVDGQLDWFDEQFWLVRFTPSWPQEQMVTNQSRHGNAAFGRWKDEPGWSC